MPLQGGGEKEQDAMTACPTCNAAPVLVHDCRGFRMVCPNRNTVPGRKAGDNGACENWTPHYRRSERAAAKTWEIAVAGEPVRAERIIEAEPGRCKCGLRLPCNGCLFASGADRNAGERQWWSGRKSHNRYSDEETRAE